MTYIAIFPNHNNPVNPFLDFEISRKFPNVKFLTLDECEHQKPQTDIIVVAPYGRNPDIHRSIVPHYISAVAKLYNKNVTYVTDYYLDDILDSIENAINSNTNLKVTNVVEIDRIFYPINFNLKRIVDLKFLNYHRSLKEICKHSNEIDLTGRSRLILSLSQLTLPEGNWTISIVYDLDEAANPNRLQFEWGSLSKFKTHCPETGANGRFETKMECILGAVERVELRIALITPAFSGRMSINEVYLEHTN